MFRPRIIPVLLLKDKGLVKSIRFKNHRYIGDPVNAVKLFNDLLADELVFLDICASDENRLISLDLIKTIGEEANMPFAVGGGIKTLEHIRSIISMGAEKVIINSEAGKNQDFIRQASETFGSSTICVCIDVKKNLFGKEKIYIKGATQQLSFSPVDFAKLMEKSGAGELILQSVDNDGLMTGYDIDLVRRISESVTIPVVALGGAGSLSDMKKCYSSGSASALAAGSMFVYHGPRRGILINYPSVLELKEFYSLVNGLEE